MSNMQQDETVQGTLESRGIRRALVVLRAMWHRIETVRVQAVFKRVFAHLLQMSETSVVHL